jgi:hypothetical protein
MEEDCLSEKAQVTYADHNTIVSSKFPLAIS